MDPLRTVLAIALMKTSASRLRVLARVSRSGDSKRGLAVAVRIGRPRESLAQRRDGPLRRSASRRRQGGKDGGLDARLPREEQRGVHAGLACDHDT